MRIPRFKPIRTVRGKSVFWRIEVPSYLHPSGRRSSCYFSTKAEALLASADYLAATRDRSDVRILSKAQQFDAIKAIEVAASHGIHDSLTNLVELAARFLDVSGRSADSCRNDAMRAFELLAKHGLESSLAEVVEAAIPALKASGQHISVASLFAEFASVKAASWSVKSMKNFRDAEKLFLPEFGSQSLVSVTARDITAWLTSRFESEGYRANITRTIRPAFSYAWRQGMIPQSPFDKIEKVKVVKKDIDVFTVDEARALMDAAAKVSTPTRAAFAVLLFAGVRPAELTRLKWGDVRDGFIHLPARITKIQQARNVELEPILAARLEEWRGDEDSPVIPRNWVRVSKAVRAGAGLSGRQDTARHSYASYHLALHKDEATLKANMGHSRNSDILFVHYRAAVTRSAALEYWRVLAP